MKRRFVTVFACVFILISLGVQDFDKVEIKTIKITESIYMLEGAGGNIGLCIGDDGAFLIDDQFAPLTDKILSAVSELTDEPVEFVINTHWHRDHVGGNENLGKAGAIIVAHENVRTRMSSDQFMEAFGSTVPAAAKDALPVITFTEDLTFHWNNEEIHIFHVEDAHTDGDSVIHFKTSNVIHMGDTFFNGMYPFIDTGSGGGINGMVKAVDRVLKLTNDTTKVIPGHGPLSNTKGLRHFRNMCATVRDRIGEMKSEGKSKEEVIAAKPTQDYDAEWGNGFLKPEQFVGIVYDSLPE